MTPLKKYIWLVDTVMRAGEKGLTLRQIAERYEQDENISDGEPYARRTFQRHRDEVLDLFGIEIECYSDGSEYRYRIADNSSNDYFRRWLLDSIAVNRIVTDSREVARYISIESTNNTALPIVLEALKDLRLVNFDYKPYWKESSTHYFNFQPHALKMFERRWYLIGRYHKTHRTFALDRMTNVVLQEENFKRDPKFDLEKMFSGSYGIIVEDIPVESIWLKVEAHQANYLRSLPLHRTQTELPCKDKDYAIFALRVRPTLDLRQKILSLGSAVEVLKPESLREEMREEVRRMSKMYQADAI